jgi:tRNA(Ile)-lysidine synthase
LLHIPRSEIERYARRRKLTWIEDESNLETHFTRNWLRREVLPVVAKRMPAYRDALARAARNASEAAALLDELAAIDVDNARAQNGLLLAPLRTLTPARMKNVLRAEMDRAGARMPDSTRLAEVVRQLLTAKAGARIQVNLGSCELRVHGGVLHLLPLQPPAATNGSIAWAGEEEIELPSGVLRMKRTRGEGMSARKLAQAAVTIRPRKGGERLQPDARRPRRTVKNLLQEAAIPLWERDRLPFIYCGDELACVPGVGVDCRFRAERGEPSVTASWRQVSL